MAVLMLFAFLSGIVTILSPCILPVLPIVLSGGMGGGKARPFGVITGFTTSFAAFTLSLTAVVALLGIPADALRYIAVVIIVAFGIVTVVPALRNRFEMLASKLAGRASGRARAEGFWGGLPAGIGLGLVWTPCVGPIMASVISLALTQKVDGGAVLIVLSYTLGTSIPMLAVMLGGRAILTRVPAIARRSTAVQRGFGVLMIVTGIAIGFGWDRRFQAAVLRVFPNYGTGLTALENAASVQEALKARASSGPVEGALIGSKPPLKDGVFGDYGPAPDFVTDGAWLNTGSLPLTMEGLRGKVVVIDFWTYSCVNCVRTIPYLKAWYETYRDKGLVIVGVHTPEFEFEKDAGNVGRAMRDLGVDWPVVLDNSYAQWNAYSNMYWPAHYFMDAQGRLRYAHFGEGKYRESEDVIRLLLAEAGISVPVSISGSGPKLTSRTPEVYLGYERAAGFMGTDPPARDVDAEYASPRAPLNGEWSLSGTWKVTGQYIAPSGSGSIELGFDAMNVFLVVEPEESGGSIAVKVDGAVALDTPDVKDGVLLPAESRLYQLVGLRGPGGHILRLDVKGRLRLFAFTFG